MLRRVLFLLFAVGLMLAVILLVFPYRSYFPTLISGSAKTVLIIYDEPSGEYQEQDKMDSLFLRQLMGHFNVTVELVSTGEYLQGSVEKYDRSFYLGVKEGQSLPSYLVQDLYETTTPVWWINANYNYLQKKFDTKTTYGFHVEEGGATTLTNSVSYKDKILWKRDDATYKVVVDQLDKVKVHAVARTSNDQIPWVIQSGSFWYLASNPFSYAVEGSCYLAFCDLLHDFLGQKHQEQHRAMLRIEDVHAMRDTELLKGAADYLYEKNIPFGFTLVPVYKKSGDDPPVYFLDKPEFLEAVRYMIAHGGTPILHGFTHQRFGETAVDYEFWSGPDGGPRLDDSRALASSIVRNGLEECFNNDIYPLVWTTPHYAASQLDYSVFKNFFTTVWERRQPVDILGSDQFFPFLIEKDMHDQIIIPESLGYLTMGPERSPEALIKDADNTLVVRDGYASFFYHTFLPLDRLIRTVEGIQELGYEFVGLTDFNNIATTGDKLVLSGTAEAQLQLDGKHLHEFTLDEKGGVVDETYSFYPVSSALRKYITMKSGRCKVLKGVTHAPPLSFRSATKFRPTLMGITHPLALVLLFIGMLILIMFLVIWIYLLLQKIIATARRQNEEKN